MLKKIFSKVASEAIDIVFGDSNDHVKKSPFYCAIRKNSDELEAIFLGELDLKKITISRINYLADSVYNQFKLAAEKYDLDYCEYDFSSDRFVTLYIFIVIEYVLYVDPAVKLLNAEDTEDYIKVCMAYIFCRLIHFYDYDDEVNGYDLATINSEAFNNTFEMADDAYNYVRDILRQLSDNGVDTKDLIIEIRTIFSRYVDQADEVYDDGPHEIYEYLVNNK